MGRLLSPAGRLLLIKHVLSSIPLHVLAAIEPPKAIILQLESLFSKFFWNASSGEHRFAWRRWKRLCYPVGENGLGIRALDDLIKAYSCKLWWKWWTHSGIWAKFVQSISLLKSKNARRLLQVDRLMRDHSIVLVHSGCCSFLYDNWTGQGPLSSLFDLEYDATLRSIRLCDVYVNYSWDWLAVREILPSPALDLLQNYHFVFTPDSDEFIWKPHAGGNFTISSAYQIVRARQLPEAVMPFIWNNLVPMKISVFGWRLLNGLLPFPEILMLKGFNLPSKCPCCPSLDSVDHAFVHCSFAQALWQYFQQSLGLHFDCSTGLYELLHASYSVSHHSAIITLQRIIPLLICWTLWRLRNAIIFDNVKPRLTQLLNYITFLIHSIFQKHPLKVHSGMLLLLHCPFLPTSSLRPFVRTVYWSLPAPHGYTLNVDGSSVQNSAHSGGGFLLRNDLGNVLHAQSDYFGPGSSFHAEVLCLLRGLQWSATHGYRLLRIESDSMLLVDMLHFRATWPWQQRSSLQEIIDLLNFSGSSIFHIFREANSAADWLAKQATSTLMSVNYSPSALPAFLRGIIILDRTSYPYLRVRFKS